MSGFKNCYYDSFKKMIYLKEQGIPGWQKFEYKPWCYITDPDNRGIYMDMYKRSLKRYDYKDPDEIDALKSSGSVVAESDLRPEVKFMHERYDKEELNVDIADWNTCFFDIEVAGSSPYYDEHMIELRDTKNMKTASCTLFDFDTKCKSKSRYEVFDEEKHCWIKYEDSCYVSYEFPAPEKAEWPINLITCYSTKKKESYTWGIKPYFGDINELPNYISCKNEVDLLDKWTKWFQHQDIDIISGWNSVSYDIPYIINRCNKLRQKYPKLKTEWERRLSPFNKMPKSKQLSDRKLEGVDLGTSYDIPGLYSIDYMELYKTFGNHPPMPSYSLNYVANFELEDSKLEYDGSINETYKYNWDRFAQYNRKDVMLIVRMEEKNKLIPLLIEYAFDCLVTLDKVQNKVPTTTGYILRFLHDHGKVLLDKQQVDEDWWADEECYKIKQPDGSIYYQNTEWENDNAEFLKYRIKDHVMNGGDVNDYRDDVAHYWKPKKLNGVLTSTAQLFEMDMQEFRKWPHPFEKFGTKAGYCYDQPGRYDDCMSFDITSSYPHHIMMFNISPETVVKHPTKEQIESGEVILSDVAEVGFKRTDDAILPNIVKKVFAERKVWKKKESEAKAAGDKDMENLCHNRQMTKKLIINSVYGVSLASGFHLYNPDCARAICRCARCTLRDWLSKYCNEYYISSQLLKDMNKYFPTVVITINNVEHAYLRDETITVMRNDTVVDIPAKDFNEKTDLLGIEE